MGFVQNMRYNNLYIPNKTGSLTEWSIFYSDIFEGNCGNFRTDALKLAKQWQHIIICSTMNKVVSKLDHDDIIKWKYFSALLAICVENSPVPNEFPTQRPVTLSFDVFFDLRLNKRLSKQSWGWWLETLSHPLWRHRNDIKWVGYHSSCVCITFVRSHNALCSIL